MLSRRLPNLANSVAPDSRPALRESWRRSWPNRHPSTTTHCPASAGDHPELQSSIADAASEHRSADLRLAVAIFPVRDAHACLFARCRFALTGLGWHELRASLVAGLGVSPWSTREFSQGFA